MNSHDWNETRKTDGADAAPQEGGPSAPERALAGGVAPSRRTCRMLRAHLAALDALEGDFRQNLGRLTAPVASGL